MDRLDFGDEAQSDGGRPDGLQLVVDLEGFEGPIDVLLTLARDQKVDLIHISILELADQYLLWVAKVRGHNLELAADYLVMAAWLAYLKSRLLLPAPEGEEEPTGEQMAAALQFQLQRLEAMQEAGRKLMAGERLGGERYARGMPEVFGGDVRTIWDVSLYDLLRAYADQKMRSGPKTLHIAPVQLYSVDDALMRLRRLLGKSPDWQTLAAFLPPHLVSGLMTKSAVAATFVASLELAKEGRLSLRQDGLYGPIFVRTANRVEEDEHGQAPSRRDREADE